MSALILSTAIAIAAEEHLNQLDKGGSPYILHPLKVMYLLKTDDYELMAMAVLHDVIEDTKREKQDMTNILINRGMTPRIMNCLKLLTKTKGQDYQEYINGIKTNIDAIRVKMADLRHNTDIRRLKGTTEKDQIRTKKYHETYEDLKLTLHHFNLTTTQPKHLIL